jgi:hypothetical protein
MNSNHSNIPWHAVLSRPKPCAKEEASAKEAQLQYSTAAFVTPRVLVGRWALDVRYKKPAGFLYSIKAAATDRPRLKPPARLCQ